MNDNKTLIPIIRNIYPTLLAQDIINVQPMTSPSGEIFDLSRPKYKITTSESPTDWKYLLQFTGFDLDFRNEATKWIVESFSKDRYNKINNYEFQFKRESDINWFKLRWQ